MPSIVFNHSALPKKREWKKGEKRGTGIKHYLGEESKKTFIKHFDAIFNDVYLLLLEININ